MRAVASATVAMLAAYYLVVAFDNVTNPASNWAFIQGVISGDGVPADSGFAWRFTEATWFQVAVYVAVIAGEGVAGVLLAVGAVRGWRSRAEAGAWGESQVPTVVGAGLGLGVFFLGFITIGGNWWVMYLNDDWNGLTPAFQNSVMTVLTLLFVLGVAGVDRLAGSGGR